MRAMTGVRILFAGQYWPGANTAYIARAFEDCGAIVRIVNETSIHPAEWWTFPGRLARRALAPLIKEEWNRQMLQLITEFRPHLVYLSNAGFAKRRTLDAIRAAGIPIVCFYHDVSWNRPGDDFIEKVGLFDLVSTTRSWQKPLIEKAGCPAVAVVRFGYEPSVHRPVRLADTAQDAYRSDLAFIATYEPHRAGQLEELVRERFPHSFRLWGGYWDRLPAESSLRSHWQRRLVHEQEIPVIYAAAKVALHWIGWEPSSDDPMLRIGDQHNSRTFQIPACGGAIMVAQRTPEHEGFFVEDKEAVFFDGIGDLREKLALWLDPARDRERVAMSAAARERCIRNDYSYRPVAASYLRHFGLPSSYEAPTGVPVTVAVP